MTAEQYNQEDRPRNIRDRLVPFLGGLGFVGVVGLGAAHVVGAFIAGGGGNNQISSPPAAGIITDAHDGEAEIDFCFSDPTAPAIVTSFSTENHTATITWPGPAGENRYESVGKHGLAEMLATHSAELQPEGNTPQFPVANGLVELAIPCSVAIPTSQLVLPEAIERNPALLDPQAVSNNGGSIAVATPRDGGNFVVTYEHIPA